MKKRLLTGLAMGLFLFGTAGMAEALLIHHEGTNSGRVTWSEMSPAFVSDSWVSVGDKMNFNYQFDFNDETYEMNLDFQIEVFGKNGFTFNRDHVLCAPIFDQVTKKFRDYDFDQPWLFQEGILPQTIDQNVSLMPFDGDYWINGILGGEWAGEFTVAANLYDFENDRFFENAKYGFGFTSEPVPEPATIVLLGIGLAVSALTRIKRKW